MSRDYIPKALRERVASRSGHRCGYCRTATFLVGTTFEVGSTPTGRATVEALQLNRPMLVYARWLWVGWGCHPPED